MQGRPYISFKSQLAALGFDSYGDYLRSDHWRSVRRQWESSGGSVRCTVCRSKRYQLHHTTYERLGAEEMTDLVALCRHCHEKAHKQEKGRGVALEEAHEQVKPVVLREEQYLQDRQRARRKTQEAWRKERNKRRKKGPKPEPRRRRESRKDRKIA